ncbi:hypothetical protein CDCA_CDCA07G2085 [Cyanidium caldarium]|uniref:DNA polymerase eta n=1 Tax=Cyanidium caldarium TaxID=2771 RepID=A0AAV9IUR9_CYACA|nr:hypothetical protein CDCA_CDCA07G2085 [Cyanidium caldarium]
MPTAPLLQRAAASEEKEHQAPRVIVHLDLDAFYAQIESKRLGLSPQVPLCVIQWSMVLAVNYAARPHGVRRGQSVEEVRRACLQCVIVHVDTVGADGRCVQSMPLEVPVDGPGVGAGGGGDNGSRTHCKASLERYRIESEKIFAILTAHCERVERASIDEAYLDLTGVVDGLEQGAQWTAQLRQRLRDALQYTSSAGIAHNKMLAKFASAKHKPDRQTVVTPEQVPQLLADARLEKIRGLGGKLGAQVRQRLRCETLGELSAMSAATLQCVFDAKTADWLYWIARGHDSSEVRARTRSHSLLAAKSFADVRRWEQVAHWLQLLASELDARLVRDEAKHRRAARTLTVSFLCASAAERQGTRTQASRSAALPNAPAGAVRVQRLQDTAMQLLRSAEPTFRFPCSRLALQASNFAERLGEAAGSMPALFRRGQKRSMGAAPEQMRTLEEGHFREVGVSARERGAAFTAAAGAAAAEPSMDPRAAPLSEMGFEHEAVLAACRQVRYDADDENGLTAAVEWLLRYRQQQVGGDAAESRSSRRAAASIEWYFRPRADPQRHRSKE